MFYDFEAEDIRGNVIKMDKYKGKVVLVVNTATQCGFTPQYEELESLYEQYGEQGLEIIEFPCNQFGNQAPESDDEIAAFCTARFGVKYDRFKKVDVNGENAHPLFAYLQQQIGFGSFDPDHQFSKLLDEMFSKQNPNYKEDPSIKWNFTKFLIDREGNVAARLEPTAEKDAMEAAIKKYL